MTAIEGAHVHKPLDNRKATGPISHVELEAVLLVEETKTLIHYLMACSEQAGTVPHIFEAVTTSSLLGTCYVWELLGGKQ